MRFRYSFTLPVTVDRAWPILLDLPRVAPCMPGAAIESGDDGTYVGRMKVKLGPIEMNFRGDLRFIERDDAAHRVKVEGSAKEIRGGGLAKATVAMQASAAGEACEVAIDSDYALSGKAAQFGTGVLDEIGTKLMKEFAARLEALIRSEGQAAAPTAGQAVAAERPGAVAVPPPGAAEAGANDEALDIVKTAWWPVMRRLAPVAGLVAVLALALWWALRR